MLVGLKRWETLVPKTPGGRQAPEEHARGRPRCTLQRAVAVARFRIQELEAALDQKTKLIGPGDLPAELTPAQRHTALGYQVKGLEFVKAQARPLRSCVGRACVWCEMLQRMRHALGLCFCEAKGTDLTPLLIAPTRAAQRSEEPEAGLQLPDPHGQARRRVAEEGAKRRGESALGASARAAFSRGRRRSNLSALAWLQGRPRGPRVWPESWSSASRMRRRLFCCYHLSCDGYNPPWTVGTQN